MSDPIPVWRGTVTPDGHLHLDPADLARRRGYLKSLAGRPVVVLIKRARPQRSLAQNRWWWGVAVPLIAQTLGYDRHEYEDLHYALVAKCFGLHHDPRLAQEIPNVRSSSLTVRQFTDLMEWAVRWAAQEYGIYVPLPDEAESE